MWRHKRREGLRHIEHLKKESAGPMAHIAHHKKGRRFGHVWEPRKT